MTATVTSVSPEGPRAGQDHGIYLSALLVGQTSTWPATSGSTCRGGSWHDVTQPNPSRGPSGPTPSLLLVGRAPERHALQPRIQVEPTSHGTNAHGPLQGPALRLVGEPWWNRFGAVRMTSLPGLSFQLMIKMLLTN